MIAAMRQSTAHAFLVDEAIDMASAEAFLSALGQRLVADGLPLAGGALTQAAPHPIVAQRTWLWRADTGRVIEALGLGLAGSVEPDRADTGRAWLLGLGTGNVVETPTGSAAEGAVLAWAATRPFSEAETQLLGEVARFAAAPLALIASRSTLAALLETYLGRRSAAQVLAGRLRRDSGETIRAALLYADLRGFTALSESIPPHEVVATLDAWFDRIAGRRPRVRRRGPQVHRRRHPGDLPDRRAGRRRPPARRRCGRSRPRGPAWTTSTAPAPSKGCRRCRSGRRCMSARCCGAISARQTASTSPPSAPP